MQEERREALEAARELLSVFSEFKRGTRRPSGGGGEKTGEMAVMGTVSAHHVKTGEGIRVSEIARILKIANPTVTQFINGLEKAGWVYRQMDALDRRSVLVFLTEEGLRHHEHFEKKMLWMFNSLTEHLGPEDSSNLIRIMRKTLPFMEQLQEQMRHDIYVNEPCRNAQSKETKST